MSKKKFNKNDAKFDSKEREKDDVKSNRRTSRSRAYNDSTKRGRNDASWYSAGDPDLLSAVARWPFSRRTGQNLPITGDLVYDIGITPQHSGKAEGHYSAPGVISMGFAPLVGNAEDPQSPINVAANAQYTFIRAANSGARNYDAPDLIIYDMAVDSIYMLLTFAARAYATVGMFSAFNKFYPDTLLAAQHLDPSSFGGSLEDYRAKLNILIRKAQSLVVSKSLPIFTRHSWMVGNYFIDGESIKQQTYMYYPISYYKFALDGSGAGMLESKQLFPTSGSGLGTITCWQLLSTIESCLDAVLGNEDFNIMSGDILKAYGSDINTLSEVPGLIVATPVFNREALMQFKNARVFTMNIDEAGGPLDSIRAFDLVQNSSKDHVIYGYVNASSPMPDPRYTDAISYDMAAIIDFSATHNDIPANLSSSPVQQFYYRMFQAQHNILISDVDNPSPEEVMVYSRLKWAIDWNWQDAGGTYVFAGVRYTFGSELPLLCEIYHMEDGIVHSTRVASEVIDYGVKNSTGDKFFIPDIICSMSKPFIYMPRRTLVYVYDDSGIEKLESLSYNEQADWDICSEIDYEHMYNLNQAAILSEFNVPRLAVSR